MDADITRYSIDVSSSLSAVSKAEEGDRLLPSSAAADEQCPGKPSGVGLSHRWRRILNLLLAGLALLLAILAAVGWILYWRASSRLHLVGEINGLVPEFPVRPVVFQEDPLSTSDPKTAESINATYEDWLSFMPVGNGFIAVEPDPQHILPPPMIDEQSKTEMYSIAVFHQLHCLHGIMRKYNELADQLELAKRGQLLNLHDLHDRDTHEMQHHARRHTDHCFRYLRQSIVCCGDTALEGQNPKAPIPDTDGTGAVHLCKDFEALKKWAEERRVVDNHGI
ncbi:uncharacterized protein B0T15DRAFT_484837 [Chaetomium strumarium]|uniref:Tat pathway signal sequence n=1 Tax=Chaetomium strumarium TaxID=1170767 RepID=A0AAJ0M138_9PEZI|nr:hypothetical protein B0T15DRAFT_484837 [Chaetomium strumarium]